MPTIEITRQDLSISQLRAEAARTADAKQARRILAIAMVLDGHARLVAAQACGMDRQTLRDWVHLYNEDGVAGLADRPRPGRPAALSDGQRAEVARWVQSGPDRKTDGVVRWCCADLRDRIAAHFGIRMHERSVGKLLHALDFSSISVRPLHPQSDLEAQEAFKNVWPAPFASDFAIWSGLRQIIRSQDHRPGQDGDPRVPVLIKLSASKHHFLNQGSRAPVDCQTILLPPPANIVGYRVS